MSCDGGHLGFSIGIKNSNLVKDIPMIIHVQFGFSQFISRLLSVVCKLFTFQASSPKPLGRLEPNLAGMFLAWSSTKLLVAAGPVTSKVLKAESSTHFHLLIVMFKFVMVQPWNMGVC
jgi:hypothetical protein